MNTPDQEPPVRTAKLSEFVSGPGVTPDAECTVIDPSLLNPDSARKKFNKMPDDEREKYIAEAKARINEFMRGKKRTAEMRAAGDVGGGVVYLLTCKVTDERFVCQAWESDERVHKYLRGKCQNPDALDRAVDKHGWSNFTADVIAQGIQTQKALDATVDNIVKLLDTIQARPAQPST